MSEARWAELRQVVLATLDHEADVERARKALHLGPSFGDPELTTIGLADATMPIGPATYLELCSPLTPDHQVARWLGKAGGSSGWALSTQVPTLEGVRQRCEELGIRIAIEAVAFGHEIVQLHPLDMGILLELDSFVPRDEWFWDDLAEAKVAQSARSTFVDDIVGVDIATPEPATLAAKWATVLGIEGPEVTEDGALLRFSERDVHFVLPLGRQGLVGVELHASERGDAGQVVELCNTELRLV